MSENNAQKNDSGKKKKSFRNAAAMLLAVGGVWWFNNYTLKTTETSYSSPKATSHFRIAVVSDLHAHKYSISGKNIMRHIVRESPDAVFVLGDMYSRGSSQAEKDMAVEAVEDMVKAGYPTYVVSGEHDYDDDYLAAIENTGAKLMNYKCEYLEINGCKVQLMGIDNVYYSPTFDLHNEFQTDEDCFSILLAHIPNYRKFAEFGADLTLCADTHGGMVQLPFGLGPAIDPNTGQWFPELHCDSKEVYDKGWFEYRNGAMFITSGIGDSPYPVRFNNRPEVVIIDIRPEKMPVSEKGGKNEN